MTAVLPGVTPVVVGVVVPGVKPSYYSPVDAAKAVLAEFYAGAENRTRVFRYVLGSGESGGEVTDAVRESVRSLPEGPTLPGGSMGKFPTATVSEVEAWRAAAARWRENAYATVAAAIVGTEVSA